VICGVARKANDAKQKKKREKKTAGKRGYMNTKHKTRKRENKKKKERVKHSVKPIYIQQKAKRKSTPRKEKHETVNEQLSLYVTSIRGISDRSRN
jgi:predicted glycosyltransferase involved in capsule biosynthesis